MSKEIRVYVASQEEYSIDELNNMSNDELIDIAELEGLVYSLNGFAQAFNKEEIYTGVDYIRFIEVEV